MSTKRVIYKGKVAKVLDLTSSVRELVIEFQDPSEFHFKAGQFLMLHVPQAEKPALRAYSIASDDRNHRQLRLLFKHVPNGVASTFVWTLKGGEILDFTGPFGRVFFVEPPEEQIVFLATGTGLAQHLCYLESKKDQYPNLHYHLYLGLGTEKDRFCEEDLNRLKKSLPNFQWHFVLSRASEAWTGKRGYVQNFISELNIKDRSTLFYLCGNGGMIKQTKHLLIGEKGVDPKQIHSEAFD